MAEPDPDPNIILSSQVAQALAVIGDRWAMLVIRDVYLGYRRFEDLRKQSGAARGTLAARLKTLVRNGILYRNPYQTSPPRYEYRLTDKGLDLYPLVLAIWNWERRWGDGYQLPPKLNHEPCGKPMTPVYVCSACERPIKIHDVRFETGRADSRAAEVPPRFQRRSKGRGRAEDAADERFFHTLDIIGDRWTGLVTAAAYFGLTRFDEIARGIGIATNILADRLKLLVRHGVMERRPYQKQPVRYEYRLTEKGRDLYLIAVAMHEWANRWILDEESQPLRLFHEPCSAPLVPRMVCSECEAELRPSDVDFVRDEQETQRKVHHGR